MNQSAVQNRHKPLKTGRFIGQVRLSPDHGPVGTETIAEGEGFSPNSSLAIIWESYDANWEIEQLDGHDWNEFRGIGYEVRLDILAEIETDEEGKFRTALTIPDDYGGLHDVYVVGGDTKLNKAGFRINVSAEVTPDSGPPGSDISVVVKGLNPAHPFEGWYQLYYDNHFVGCLTAVTTRGTAHVEIPAVGAPGKHIIGIELATYGSPFIQTDVSSYSYVKTFHIPFEITDKDAIMPPPIQEQIQMERPGSPPQSSSESPVLWSDYIEIPSRSAFRLFGRGFPANSELEIRWVDIAGDRVSEVQSGRFGTGFQELSKVLCKAPTDQQGDFEMSVTPESVQGGAHPVEAWLDGEMLARTYVIVGRRAHPLRPKVGPVGTPITVEVDGVGWTEHENEVAYTYDNSYVGYACGADLMGKVVPKIYATGQPGWHFIDLYPTIRNAPEFLDGRDKPAFYRRPILTWRDHPHGFHFRYAYMLENEDKEDHSTA